MRHGTKEAARTGGSPFGAIWAERGVQKKRPDFNRPAFSPVCPCITCDPYWVKMNDLLQEMQYYQQ